MKKRAGYLAMLLAAGLLTAGCNGQTQADTSSVPEQKENQGKETLSIEAQLRLIDRSREDWMVEYQKLKYDRENLNKPAEYYFPFGSEAPLSYAVTDLDQNGRLEIITTTTNGNGRNYHNQYYEVNETGDALEEISQIHGKKGCDAPDWGVVLEQGGTQVYYDSDKGEYHYVLGDFTHGSAIDHEYYEQDFVLHQGEIEITSYLYEKQDRKGVKYYSLAGSKKARISGQEWDSAAGEHFAGLAEGKVRFGEFDGIMADREKEEDKYLKLLDEPVEKRLERLGEEGLYEKLKNSWEQFSLSWKEE